jgi:hypothetical protein
MPHPNPIKSEKISEMIRPYSVGPAVHNTCVTWVPPDKRPNGSDEARGLVTRRLGLKTPRRIFATAS